MAQYDVIVVGGSSAGLSAATMLGRALRKTLVIDSGLPCNRFTSHSHNFLTHDGDSPQSILAAAREQLKLYTTVSVLNGLVTAGRKDDNGIFYLTTSAGETFTAKRVLLATGVVDILPTISGFTECWGKSVVHCPYCHGFEVHSQPTGIFNNGKEAEMFTKVLRNWSKDLTLLTNGPATFSPEFGALLAARNIRVVETPVAEVEHEGGHLHHVRLTDGQRIPLKVIYAKVAFSQSSNLDQQLGCERTENGLIKVDDFGATTTPGVFAAGDCSTLIRQISVAVGLGAKAAAILNHGLCVQEF
eukprot:TRINITY_DN7904_c0_g1_i1.p1 TRINITY_DN7904_c0_g1~~TRINITY_DN7904_c0_g1_i1.p1  ORF type:complete len:301 (-),score=57.03 TRINITY_DN7904_c0_g1_i1:19-921(-)